MSDAMEMAMQADKIGSSLADLERLIKEVRKLYGDAHQQRLTKTLEGINPKLVALKQDLEDLAELVPTVMLVKDLDERTVRHIVKELSKLMRRHNIGDFT